MTELSRDMRILADVIGEETALRLMVELGGMYLYIPKPSRCEIAAQLKENGYDAKAVACKLKVSLSRVYKVLEEVRGERSPSDRRL